MLAQLIEGAPTGAFEQHNKQKRLVVLTEAEEKV